MLYVYMGSIIYAPVFDADHLKHLLAAFLFIIKVTPVTKLWIYGFKT